MSSDRQKKDNIKIVKLSDADPVDSTTAQNSISFANAARLGMDIASKKPTVYPPSLPKDGSYDTPPPVKKRKVQNPYEAQHAGGPNKGPGDAYVIDKYDNPMLILKALEDVNKQITNTPDYLATMKAIPRIPGMGALYSTVNITYNNQNLTAAANSSSNSNAGTDATNDNYQNGVKSTWYKIGYVSNKQLREIRTYANEHEPDIKRLHDIKMSRALGGGYEAKSCDDVTPTWFWDDDNHAALGDMLDAAQWHETLYGFCVVGFPKNPMKWALDRGIFETYEEFKENLSSISNSTNGNSFREPSGRSKRFSSSFNGRLSQDCKYQELLPCMILDPVDLGDIEIYIDTVTGTKEYVLSASTALADLLMKSNRLIVYKPSGCNIEIDSSGKVNTPISSMLDKYIKLRLYEIMNDRVASQLSLQLVVLQTDLKYKDETRMTDQELDVVASSTNRPNVVSSSIGRDMAARTNISIDGLQSLINLAKMETTSFVDTSNTLLNIDQRRSAVNITAQTKIENPMDTIYLSDLDRMNYKALDANIMQNKDFIQSSVRISDAFSLAAIHRPQIVVDTRLERSEYQHSLYNALGIPPALLDNGRLSSGGSKGSGGKSGSKEVHKTSETSETVGLAMGVTIKKMRSSMEHFFDFFYKESMAVLDTRKIEEIIDKLNYLCGSMLMQINLRSVLNNLLKNGYNAIVNMQVPLDDEEEQNGDNKKNGSKKPAKKSSSSSVKGKKKIDEEEREFQSKRPSNIQMEEEERPVQEDVVEQNNQTLKKKIDEILKQIDEQNPKTKWLNENFKPLMRILYILEQKLNSPSVSSRVRLVFKQSEESVSMENATFGGINPADNEKKK